MTMVWFETEAETKDCTGPATASLLESIAQTLRECPNEKRYDMQITITEKVIEE